ncbi:MAG: hypothetical protein ACK5NY_10355 [Burkholderiaceae bacterium]
MQTLPSSSTVPKRPQHISADDARQSEQVPSSSAIPAQGINGIESPLRLLREAEVRASELREAEKIAVRVHTEMPFEVMQQEEILKEANLDYKRAVDELTKAQKDIESISNDIERIVAVITTQNKETGCRIGDTQKKLKGFLEKKELFAVRKKHLKDSLSSLREEIKGLEAAKAIALKKRDKIANHLLFFKSLQTQISLLSEVNFKNSFIKFSRNSSKFESHDFIDFCHQKIESLGVDEEIKKYIIVYLSRLLSKKLVNYLGKSEVISEIKSVVKKALHDVLVLQLKSSFKTDFGDSIDGSLILIGYRISVVASVMVGVGWVAGAINFKSFGLKSILTTAPAVGFTILAFLLINLMYKNQQSKQNLRRSREIDEKLSLRWPEVKKFGEKIALDIDNRIQKVMEKIEYGSIGSSPLQFDADPNIGYEKFFAMLQSYLTEMIGRYSMKSDLSASKLQAKQQEIDALEGKKCTVFSSISSTELLLSDAEKKIVLCKKAIDKYKDVLKENGEEYFKSQGVLHELYGLKEEKKFKKEKSGYELDQQTKKLSELKSEERKLTDELSSLEPFVDNFVEQHLKYGTPYFSEASEDRVNKRHTDFTATQLQHRISTGCLPDSKGKASAGQYASSYFDRIQVVGAVFDIQEVFRREDFFKKQASNECKFLIDHGRPMGWVATGTVLDDAPRRSAETSQISRVALKKYGGVWRVSHLQLESKSSMSESKTGKLAMFNATERSVLPVSADFGTTQ